MSRAELLLHMVYSSTVSQCWIIIHVWGAKNDSLSQAPAFPAACTPGCTDTWRGAALQVHPMLLCRVTAVLWGGRKLAVLTGQSGSLADPLWESLPLT